ncbi:recombinase family protein [Anaerobacillus sp. CMMVII]|uniref:recombinase family protein n=1 Tax=Anaerobacillus sp. CMMVII TaxID=2755588 RepID=UPI0021B7D1C3|nr:recombinase family protein [Anaerobacillus sp. CMMVII]MCT8139968.1 recombinase family protein [Anaerobacillus sp. CMMVII]
MSYTKYFIPSKEEQKTSLENQQRYFFNVIAEKGWDLYRFYVDVETGTKDKKRKNLLQLIKDAKERKFDIILSKELSRLARNGKLSYEIKDIAEKNNIHIVTFDNAINSIDGNIHMFGLYAWLYEQESQRTSERIKAALFTNAKKGDFHGSNAPYGYKVIDKKLYPSEDTTPHITKRIYDMYLSGMGFDSIARLLTSEGVPTPAAVAGKVNAGEFWHGSTIKKILMNPHYTGDLVQCRETTRSVKSEARHPLPKEKHVIIKDAHQPLISRDDFEAVQHMITTRKKNITKGKKHLFTNLLYCSDCGTGMWYRQNRDGYICGRYARYGKNACCQRTIKEKHLQSLILADVTKMSLLVNSDSFIKDFNATSEEAKKRAQKDLLKIDKNVEELKLKKKRYLELLAADAITHEEYRDAADATQEELKILSLKRSELNASLQDETYMNEKVLELRRVINSFLPLNEVTDELLHCFVNRIEVDKNGTPKISYRFSILPD